MTESRITLFKLFGFTVRLDASWIFIAVLVTWTLAVGYFPTRFPDMPSSTYWIMGVCGAFGLFVSIVFHEFWHSLIARRFGLRMRGITLFIFGGIAEMDEEPQKPGTEFWMAVAGPIASIVLGAVFYGIYRGGEDIWHPGVGGVISYLALINWILAGFNLFPAFPLDGGRILRSALWHWQKDLRRATRTAARFGAGFGFVLMALGLLSILAGNLVGGLWYGILGLFLRGAARMSYKQVLVREAFETVPVRNLMVKNPVCVPAEISLTDLVENYIYTHHYKMFPVVTEGRLVGCVTSRSVKEVPREEWERRSVGSVAGRCAEGNTIAPDSPVTQALAMMNRSGNSRLMVVEEEKLVGIIALKDILGALSTRMDMEEDRL